MNKPWFLGVYHRLDSLRSIDSFSNDSNTLIGPFFERNPIRLVAIGPSNPSYSRPPVKDAGDRASECGISNALA